jgi:hypothetical protein
MSTTEKVNQILSRADTAVEVKIFELIMFFINDPTAHTSLNAAELILFQIVEFLFVENKRLKARLDDPKFQ